MGLRLLRRLPGLVSGYPRRLASVKLGSMLMIALLVFTLVAAFFPVFKAAQFVRGLGQVLDLENLSRVSELSFQERFESMPFLVLVIVLSLSLCLSLFFRIRSELRRQRSERAAFLPDRTELRHIPGSAGVALAAVSQELRRRGYRSTVNGSAPGWRIHAVRGAAGFWGSVAFHVGILMILAAALMSGAASMRASVKLTEGQAFDSRVDKYGFERTGRWYSPGSQPLTFRLVRVVPDYQVTGATTVASIVEPTLEGRASRFMEQTPVYINNGLRHAGMTIHQGRDTGFAPFVIVEDTAGKRLLQGYMQLATMVGAGPPSYLDSFALKERGLNIDFELLPDAVYRNDEYLSRSGALKNPVLHVVVRDANKPVFDEFIPVTRDFAAGGYRVFFGDVRRWSQLDVSDVPGVPMLIAGALLGTLGLGLRLLCVRRRVLVHLSETGSAAGFAFEVTGSSEKFQGLFREELAGIRNAIAQRLGEAAISPGGDPLAAR